MGSNRRVFIENLAGKGKRGHDLYRERTTANEKRPENEYNAADKREKLAIFALTITTIISCDGIFSRETAAVSALKRCVTLRKPGD